MITQHLKSTILFEFDIYVTFKSFFDILKSSNFDPLFYKIQFNFESINLNQSQCSVSSVSPINCNECNILTNIEADFCDKLEKG